MDKTMEDRMIDAHEAGIAAWKACNEARATAFATAAEKETQ